MPRTVWVLGLVSLFMDTSSEMIHSVLPLFLVSGLGASVIAVGVIEGIADATAQVTKVFSGTLSDWLGRRKMLTVLGYGLAAATKPIFPLATGMPEVLFARFLDRFGKGIRGAPRDAMIADVTPPHLRGASYGLRQALDSVGAVAGPLLAAALLAVLAGNMRLVMWAAVVPAILSVSVLVFGIKEKAPKEPTARRMILQAADFVFLGSRYWTFVFVAVGLTMSRFSEAFLLLRAQNVGLAPSLVPLVFVAMNIVFAIASFPAGRLSDRIGRDSLLVAGFAVLVLAQALVALAHAPALVFAGAALWGLHLGLTQGVFSAIVADLAPAALRGTGFGIFYLATGLALLVGSVVTGWLWQHFSPAVPFAAGAVLAAVSVVAFLVFKRLNRLAP
ncbi:MAG: MFS transporter [Alphaproteobacteria bacterium]